MSFPETSINDIADLHERSFTKITNQFFREFASWLREEQSPRDDGMQGALMDMKPVMLRFIRALMKAGFVPRKQVSKKERIKVMSAQGIFAISTEDDSIESWVSGGESFVLIQLILCSEGLSSTPLYGMISSSEIRQELRTLHLRTKEQPQMLVAFGLADNETDKFTPRASL